ncbi:hypothetical protein VPH35_044689 [Triticum aestivum]
MLPSLLYPPRFSIGPGDRRRHRPPGTPLHCRRLDEENSKMLAYASDVGCFSFRGDLTMAQGPPLPCCGTAASWALLKGEGGTSEGGSRCVLLKQPVVVVA